MTRAVLVDTTMCIGCRGCQVACKQANGNPAETTEFFAKSGGYQNPADLSAKTFSLVTFNEIEDDNGKLNWVFARRQCMHCTDPSCVSACIVGALQKKEDGATVYDETKCIGCRYCMLSCPFGVPSLEWEKPVALIRKCSFCDARVNSAPVTELNGAQLDETGKGYMAQAQSKPSCVSACATGAMKHGERSQLLAEAHSRISENPGKYVAHVYGENEVGGTNWLYLSAVPFQALGFRIDLGDKAYPAYTRSANEAVAPVVLGVGALLGGFYWITNRRARLAEEKEGGKKS